MTTLTERCIELLVPLVIVSLAFILSLVINIAHCIVKHRKVKVMKYCSQGTISYDDQHYIENNPIYGNLSLPILDHNNDECCYEPMGTPHERNMEKNQVDSEEQMCYADLDLSPKRPGKNRRKKGKPNSKQSFEELDRTNVSILSRSSIYLNSEQLTAEFRAEEELIHDDPVRIYHLMKKTRKNLHNEEEN